MKLLTTRLAKLVADFPREGPKPFSPELYNTFREILFLLDTQEGVNTEVIGIIGGSAAPIPPITSVTPDWSRIFLTMGS